MRMDFEEVYIEGYNSRFVFRDERAAAVVVVFLWVTKGSKCVVVVVATSVSFIHS